MDSRSLRCEEREGPIALIQVGITCVIHGRRTAWISTADAETFGADWEHGVAVSPVAQPPVVRQEEAVHRNHRTYAALGVIAVIGLSSCSNDPDSAGLSTDPAVSAQRPDRAGAPNTRSMPPWPAPTNVSAHVAAAGLDLGPMGTAEHYHPKLRIVIDGAEVPVPPNIGVDPATGAMSALHTHEDDGTVHIEADSEDEAFTLGQFFTQWGVALTPAQIGGVRATKGQEVQLTSNSVVVEGNPADLRLEPEQQILLTLG